MFMCGLDFLFSPSTEIAIVSEKIDELTSGGLRFIRSIFNPNKIVILKLSADNDVSDLLSFTNDMKMKDNMATFFVCRDYSCNQPVNTVAELEKLL